ncbi:hypothetical protein CMV_024455 [Castanea mollissima]|uniref:Uncharacterized protein n=1 Tax=Castanea mollissima TaxID=60419 RepID=A0A8J4QAM1_9ROSI|nr:hypothetical protein CMV_024455 [Castanea mollissima]
MSASVTQHLHSPVVSHSSLSHPQSATPKAVASSIVFERCMKLYEEEMAKVKWLRSSGFPKWPGTEKVIHDANESSLSTRLFTRNLLYALMLRNLGFIYYMSKT